MADRMGILAPGKCLHGGFFDRCYSFQLVEEILEAAAEGLLHVGCCRSCGISCAAESSAIDSVARVMFEGYCSCAPVAQSQGAVGQIERDPGRTP